MKEANNFINQLTKGITESINVSLLGRVENVNSVNMIADVKPLKKDLPLIQNVPIVMMKVGDYFIRSNIKIGDIVVLLISDYSLEGYLDNGSIRDPVIKERHTLDNAIIVGVIAPLNTDPTMIKDLNEVII